MDKQGKTPELVARMVVQVAARQGWVPNPDAAFRSTIEQGLLKNHQRHGYFLCPCRDGDGDREADRDIVCPCVYARPDIQEYGQCYCGLYLSEARAREDRPLESIPERRPSF